MTKAPPAHAPAPKTPAEIPDQGHGAIRRRHQPWFPIVRGAAVGALVTRVRDRIPVMIDPNIRPFSSRTKPAIAPGSTG